jgi:hypothetical protein
MVVQNPEAARNIRSSDGRAVAECQNSIDILSAHHLENRIGCGVRRLEMNGNRSIAPRIFQLMATIRDKHKFGAEFSSGFVEAACLVTEFGGEKEESRHLLLA